ncbi:MAG: hypothetical protein H6836_01335 [Planctomycetes bacterium]|nr:hypothetical protein [Planctomycetota bacterium]
MFHLTNHQVGQVFGRLTLWPIALTMIGFSLVVDRTGYKWPMVSAFVLQAASESYYFADSYLTLLISPLCAPVSSTGSSEAVINPVCTAVCPRKTKRLTILHALHAWRRSCVQRIGDHPRAGGLELEGSMRWILLPAGACFSYNCRASSRSTSGTAGVPMPGGTQAWRSVSWAQH